MSDSKKNLKPKVVKIKWTEKEEKNEIFSRGRLKEYTVPADELDSVHVELEKEELKGLEKTSKPYVQKFDLRAFDNFRKNGRMLGFSHIRVLYAPEGVNTKIETAVEVKVK